MDFLFYCPIARINYTAPVSVLKCLCGDLHYPIKANSIKTKEISLIKHNVSVKLKGGKAVISSKRRLK